MNKPSENQRDTNARCDNKALSYLTNSPQNWEGSYAQTALEPYKALGWKDEYNQIDEHNFHFSPSFDDKDNLDIKYIDLVSGLPLVYKKPGSRWNNFYKRTRLKDSFCDDQGKRIKYLSEKRSGNRTYANGLHIKFRYHNSIPTLIITEGEKKALAGCLAGVPTVAGAGIHNLTNNIKNIYERTIDSSFLPDLQEIIRLKAVKKIVFIHDADAVQSGSNIDRALSFWSSIRNMFYACQHAGVEMVYKYIRHDAGGKGLDDILLANLHDIELIRQEAMSDEPGKYFNSFTIRSMRDLMAIRPYFAGGLQMKADKTISIKQYIGEEASALTEYIQEHKRVILKAGTGAGKTTFSIEDLPKAWPGRVVILQPLNSIIDGLVAQYPNVFPIRENADGFDIEAAMRSKIIACTYDSFHRISKHLKDDDIIIADEIHYLVGGYSWKAKQPYMHAFDKLLNHPYVVLASATPPALLQQYGFSAVVFNIAHRNRIKVIRQDFRGSVSHQLVRMIRKADASKGKVVIRLNAKLHKIKNIIAAIDRQDLRYSILRSSNKHEPDSIYTDLTQQNLIPDQVDVLFVTSLVDCGVNIYNQDIQFCINADDTGRISVDDLKQFAARFRHIDNLSIYNLKKREALGKPEENRLRPVSERYCYEQLLDYAKQECYYLNKEIDVYRKREKLAGDYGEDISTFNETGKYCSYNEEHETFEVNHLAILHEVKDRADRYKPLDVFYTELSQEPHIDVVSESDYGHYVDEQMSLFEQQEKEHKNSLRISALALLRQNVSLFFEAVYFFVADRQLKNKIEHFFSFEKAPSIEAHQLFDDHKTIFESDHIALPVKRFLKLKRFGIVDEAIINIMIRYDSNRQFGDLMHKLTILKNIRDFSKLRGTLRRDMERIIASKERIAALHSEETTADMLTSLVNLGRHKAHKLTKNKALQLVNIFCETHRCGHGNDTIKIGEFRTYEGFLTELLDIKNGDELKCNSLYKKEYLNPSPSDELVPGCPF